MILTEWDEEKYMNKVEERGKQLGEQQAEERLLQIMKLLKTGMSKQEVADRMDVPIGKVEEYEEILNS